ncbi:YbhB/YbcL family Raf kinase inhibitor-like protein [Geomesophilobacter sediminis]|uniref:YbhB/YbcL family Raf kinase inhibitor-like protein n=1 Tax=Geomesophilobacter sediminis TaxID=2798584 RepID=A0A8J7M3G0_9BACT|nr:YbhB/YbcL family Raf kinase inhibitor-like protein [Geomesophilobacter sediminis]MBJ6727943.1 YbhB/YbcL family Raf kinase inhibitor-like protein [Geomesophilobacter sediminis]
MRLTSPAFVNDGAIPQKYTCDGDDINPPLAIDAVPVEAKSLALIVDDPDAPAGTWVHWLLWDINPHTGHIAENSIPNESSAGLNSWGRPGYGGPCPPSGTHRYVFHLYALGQMLRLPESSDRKALETAMQGKILAQCQLVGLYRRR